MREFTLTPSDEFLILASDGVWEFVSIQEAVHIVGGSPSPESGCKRLMQHARARWRHKEKGTYVDDITAMVIGFTQRATPSPADGSVERFTTQSGISSVLS